MSPSGRYDGPVKPAKHPRLTPEPPQESAQAEKTPTKTAKIPAVQSREALIKRVTKETEIEASLKLGSGQVDLDLRALGFFGHMLNTLCRYASFGLSLKVKGDKYVDDHHTLEDIGLVLGEALATCLGDYSSHARFGWALTPMDESLAEVVIDLGRRPYLRFEVNWPQAVTGVFELCLVEEFFRAFSQKAGLTIHLIGRHGHNSHHLCEALFKATGLALAQATALREGQGPFSTKGVL